MIGLNRRTFWGKTKVRRRLAAALMVCLAATGCARNAGQVAEEGPAPSFSPTPSSSPSPTETPLPITLEGPVNNKAVSDLTGMGTAVKLEIAMADLAFNPTFVKVVPGANLTVTLKNPGGLADHTFTIDALGVDRQLKPAEQADQEVQLPSTPEAIRFYCRLHVEKGMQGAFYFTEGDPVSATTTAPSATARGTAGPTSRRSSPAVAPTGRATGNPRSPSPDLDVVGKDGDVRTGDGRAGRPGAPGLPGEPGEPGIDGADGT
jgi:plastocyanin